MPKWLWIERKFNFDFPPEKWPDLLERLRGLPSRAEDRIRGLSPEILTRRPKVEGWSIQQNIGHLIDLEYLPMRRIDQILSGQRNLIAADMTNKKTHDAGHNERPIAELLRELRAERTALVDKFESLRDEDWAKSGLHPRLQTPMRIVDVAYFTAEHDDYHMGRIGELIRTYRA